MTYSSMIGRDFVQHDKGREGLETVALSPVNATVVLYRGGNLDSFLLLISRSLMVITVLAMDSSVRHDGRRVPHTLPVFGSRTETRRYVIHIISTRATSTMLLKQLYSGPLRWD